MGFQLCRNSGMRWNEVTQDEVGEGAKVTAYPKTRGSLAYPCINHDTYRQAQLYLVHFYNTDPKSEGEEKHTEI